MFFLINIFYSSTELLQQRQQMDSCRIGSNNTIADMFCRFKKNNSSALLANTRSIWTYQSALAVGQRPEPCSSSLEFEALAAVHRLSFAVRDISVSEMLPRTSQLIFVNVTTLEGLFYLLIFIIYINFFYLGQPYCLELTAKGWRITSLRTDCMQGDFTRMELFTAYYESVYDLMSVISPTYKQQAIAMSTKHTVSSLEDEEFDDEEGN